MREALADGPKTVKELGELGAGFVGTLGLWVDLVRVPPSGHVGAASRRPAGPRRATGSGRATRPRTRACAHLVRAYLRAFGPAPWRDIASWAGVSVADVKRGAAGLVAGRATATRTAACSSTLPTLAVARPGHRRRRSGSCRTGTPTCWSTRGGPASCPRRIGRASSARRTRSRSGTCLVDGIVAVAAWSLARRPDRPRPVRGPAAQRSARESSASARRSRPSTPDVVSPAAGHLEGRRRRRSACPAGRRGRSRGPTPRPGLACP